jgi:hypothetical protein
MTASANENVFLPAQAYQDIIAVAAPIVGKGRTYYVNNVTGTTAALGADGLSWDTAFNDINEAITAAEAYRTAQTANNRYIRNRILIQGTNIDYATVNPYPSITALPNYCDIIGVGASALGDGGGIVVIGQASTDGAAGSQRGNNWYNIQFLALSDTYWAMDTVNTLRTTFDSCSFMGRAATTASGGGFRATGNCGGVTFKNCHIGTNGAAVLVYGIYAASVTFNNCHIEDCVIAAKTAGIYLTGCDDSNTVIRRNFIWGGVSTQVVTGIAAGIHSFIAGNYITASSDAISGATAVNTVDNQVIDNTTAAREKA